MPEIIFTGNNVKLMRLKSLNMTFVDSYLIFGTALKNLPKMFGFAKECKKGDFPHKFNNPENYNYIGPMPNLKYYDIERMKEDTREKFIKWYNEQVKNNYVFNFQEELNKYCAMDVQILLKAVVAYRKEVINLEGCDPFQYSTIEGIAQNTYLSNHMPEDKL